MNTPAGKVRIRMRAERFSPAAGWRWAAEGFALFRKSPGFVNFLWFATWLGVLVVSLFPVIGQAVGSLLMPGLLAGIFNGCRALERGEKPNPAVLLSAFQQSRGVLLRVGAAYLLASSVVFAASLLLAGDALQPLMSGKDLNAPIDPEVAKQLLVQLLITLQLALVLSSPTLVAAPLAAWHGLPVGKALFFALVGVLRNLAPLGVLYLIWIMMSLGLPWLLLSVAPGALKTVLQLVVSFALAFVVVPAAIASFYRAISDIFQRDGELGS